MNPCPCGAFFGDSARECCAAQGGDHPKAGTSTKISGPLLDRIDLHVEVPAVPYQELRGKDGNGATSAQNSRASSEPRAMQNARGFYNAQIPVRQLRQLCALDEAGERTLEDLAVRRMGLSARAHDRILKVARSIADLAAEDRVTAKHLAEAVQYRSLDQELLAVTCPRSGVARGVGLWP